MSHIHHDHGSADAAGSPLTSRQTRWVLGGIVAVVAVAAVVGGLLLRPDANRPMLGEELGFTGELVHATATHVRTIPCRGTAAADGIPCDHVSLRITSGPTEGDEGRGPDQRHRLGGGDPRGRSPVVDYEPGNPRSSSTASATSSAGAAHRAVGALRGAVVALGRWQGVRALVGLVVTGVVMVGFMFPSILDGHDPTAVALVAAVVIGVVALYLTHGDQRADDRGPARHVRGARRSPPCSRRCSPAAPTSPASAPRTPSTCRSRPSDVDIQGLVLAGIIIGSLGVLDDVTVTQVSAVWQLHAANPAYGAGELYAVGRRASAATTSPRP